VAEAVKVDPASEYAHEPEADREFVDPPQIKDEGKDALETPAGPPRTPRKHPQWLVRSAVRHGATQEQIEAASTNDLHDWVDLREAERERAREDAERSRALNEAEIRQRQVPTKQEPEPDEDEALIAEVEKEVPGISGSLLKVLRKLSGEKKQLKSAIKEATEREAVRTKKDAETRIEDAFAVLPKEVRKFYGEGGVGDITPAQRKLRVSALVSNQINPLDPPSPAVLARKLEEYHAEMAQAFGAKPKEAPKETNAYAEAAAEMEEEKPATNGKRFTEEQFKSGALAKTTQRVSREPKSRKTAYRAVAEQMREMNISDSDFDDYLADGLPE